MGQIDILMPALSPTMEKGTLAKWRVKTGDKVSPGNVIAEIETDKATMEVEAVDEGVISDILIKEGTEDVKINTPIARLSDSENATSPPPALAPRLAAGLPSESPILSPAARRIVEENQLDVGEIVGGGRGGRITKADALAACATLGAGLASTADPQPALSEAPRADCPEASQPDRERNLATPLAQRIAAQKGLDLSLIHGSGLHGRILRADLEFNEESRTPSPPTTAPHQVQSLEQQGVHPGSYDIAPLDGMRKTVARRMTDSFRDVPHFPLTVDLKIDALLAVRSKLNAILEKDGVKVSVNDMVIKAAATALKRVPEANASYTPDGIAIHHHADISIAVAVPGGLITPIIFSAETKGLAEIAKEAKDLAARARDRKLKPEEYLGGTFSISNLGMFGMKSFASILNAPQGCIMSVGAGEKRPVVRDEQIVAATVMSVTLTCDHRAIDGATAAGFLAAFRALIEDPITMIA